MNREPYNRPFIEKEIEGEFTWPELLSRKLGIQIHHACHHRELFKYLRKDRLTLKPNSWDISFGDGTWSSKGVWVGLNYFKCNRYGPFLISFPIEVLNGKKFLVFQRDDKRYDKELQKYLPRKRYFFVQYEGKIPYKGMHPCETPEINPADYFSKYNNYWNLKSNDIYDIVLTQELCLEKVKSINVINHIECISKKGCKLEDKEIALSKYEKAMGSYLNKKIGGESLTKALKLLSHGYYDVQNINENQR